MSQWTNKLPFQLVHLAVLVLAAYFAIHFPSIWTIGLFICFLILFGIKQTPAAKVSLIPLLLLISVVFALQRQIWKHDAQQEIALPQQIELIPDSIQINGDQLSFRGKAHGQLLQVFYRLKTEKEQAYFSQLTKPVTMELDGRLDKPEQQRNFNGFDYRFYLYTQGIHHILKIEHITKLTHSPRRNPFQLLSSWRRAAIVYSQKTFPAPMRHYVTGLLFGYLGRDFDDMSNIYSSLGIIHLFALSGMQVGFFVDRFRTILLRLGFTREQVSYLQYPFSLFYAGMTGFSISVIRSLIQKIFGNFGFSKLDQFSLTLLSCLLIQPRFLMTVGGILSFSYAFILIVFQFDDAKKWKQVLLENTALSLGILPLLMSYFYQFQPLSLLLTFLFSLLFDSLLLPTLSLFFLLSAVFDFSWFNHFFIFLEKTIVWISHHSMQPFVLGKPSPLFFLLLVMFLILLHDYRRQKIWCMFLCCLLILVGGLVKYPLENEITMVDVGQGDSFFLRDLRGRTMLIDVGGRVDFDRTDSWRVGHRQANAQRTLIPYLHSRGIGHIDSLVLTHTDSDHIGDLLEVAKSIHIGRIYVSAGSLTNPSFVKTLQSIQTPVTIVQVGDRFPIFDSYLEVLYPNKIGDGQNNDSIVLYGKLLHTSFLFTGDLEEGELELINHYPKLPVDVLKAGHHGSKGSSHPEFLEHISPKIALISAGKQNRYQHPHPETLERFESQQVRVFRTDQQGAVRFKGWNRWHIETVRTKPGSD